MSLSRLISDSLALAHPGWHAALRRGLDAMNEADSTYLAELENDVFLPTENRLFAAFSQPLEAIRYILVGEGPYPRAESASGYCFMDAAVKDIWSDKGLSKQVNRATSLRNFIKMLLVAEGTLQADFTGGDAMVAVAQKALAPDSSYVTQLDELQAIMLDKGFLLLNATLVYREHVAPARESKAWLPFFSTILDTIASYAASSNRQPPLLILWGKIAEKLTSIPALACFPQSRSEHPYNLSFISNKEMQNLFAPMNILKIK